LRGSRQGVSVERAEAEEGRGGEGEERRGEECSEIYHPQATRAQSKQNKAIVAILHCRLCLSGADVEPGRIWSGIDG
jgi:hypothetical protein